ncbi:hypothetical protein EVAR_67006_1 [Eumeta japonica]|uniref:Uncharacterized protein n=1 Tax=Eumeta variegata TaxID=151549 RepID=A0A4C1ZVT7_EUMVA|nr:hypothetical protein EVAR_67006_1 [Eumeta japonica]
MHGSVSALTALLTSFLSVPNRKNLSPSKAPRTLGRMCTPKNRRPPMHCLDLPLTSVCDNSIGYASSVANCTHLYPPPSPYVSIWHGYSLCNRTRKAVTSHRYPSLRARRLRLGKAFTARSGYTLRLHDNDA